MKRNPSYFLQDILESIERINTQLGTRTFEEFTRDITVTDAVVHRLEIIGEATKNLPSKLRKRYPEVPWADMASMRDKIAHFYFGIDYKIVWNVVKEKLPVIKPVIERMLKDSKGESLFE